MAVRLVIDGYNLVAALWGMGTSARELERQRAEMIRMLARYREQRPHPIHVVWDGWKDGDPMGSRTVDHGIRVTFSPKGITADEVIRDLLAESDRVSGTVVVTSDRTVQGWARSAGAESVESWSFVDRLTLAGAEGVNPEAEGEAEDEVWSGDTRKKGNPRRASRRKKAVERQLKKL
ncbi:MAG: NYN domain-containing protein [Nitrospirota bacterium]|nr:NYN domain-containing protein [Nitrospirota bacterium]